MLFCLRGEMGEEGGTKRLKQGSEPRFDKASKTTTARLLNYVTPPSDDVDLWCNNVEIPNHSTKYRFTFPRIETIEYVTVLHYSDTHFVACICKKTVSRF